MTNGVDLHKNMALTTASQIAEICQPFIDLGITYFQYIKRFEDGSRIVLSNCPQLVQYYYDKGFYPSTWYDNDNPITEYQTGWEFWPIKQLNNTPKQAVLMERLRILFDISQGITYLQTGHHFVEIYCFLSSYNSIYQLSPNTLQHCIFYFKNKAKKIIDHAEKERIIIPIQDKQRDNEKENKESFFLKTTPIKRYYLRGSLDGTYLTCREIDCLIWCIQGKTAEEISIILNIEEKTVKNHLQKIKEKLACYKQTQLALIAIQQGILPIQF